ncbi:MAG: peptide chain release factor 1 [Acidobacteriota bacterium]|jgi:peptide chain release factor 1
MLAKLESLTERFEELERQLGDASVVADPSRYRDCARAYAELEPIIERFREYRKVERELEEARVLAEEDDPEMARMARQEIARLRERSEVLEGELRLLLIPKDPNDDKNVILEVRAGTGGDEATLFAQEILRMYIRYAEGRGWKAELLSSSESGAGGLKEAVMEIRGQGAFSRLKHESGVHRVQRVPETEASGRIHTSAVTVAVLPEADDVDIAIDEKELRIDTFCSSGPGGQSVNTTYSAVRITHLPTGLVVSQQDEKSWHKNKAKAMKVLRSRLYDLKLREQQEEIARERKGMVGTGDRSEKIRTYNFPQNRISDHRISFTTHRLHEVLDGRIDELIDPLVSHYQAERLGAETRS